MFSFYGTTHEERRLTLDTLLHDEERYMMRHDQVPRWLQVGTTEVNATNAALSKKPSTNVFTNSIPTESVFETERRVKCKGKKPVYKELDDEHGKSSDPSSEERHEEDENGDFEDEEEGTPGIDMSQSEEDVPLYNYSYEYVRVGENSRSACLLKEPGYSSDSQRFVQRASPSSYLQKFTSLSALGARPISLSKRQCFDLEDGEIAVSGDSHVDLQQSGSWNHDLGRCEDEQVLQPKIKQKRSVRLRPRAFVGRREDRPAYDRISLNCRASFQFRSREKILVCQLLQVMGGFDASNYVTERKFATALDGVQVPISIVYQKNLVNLDGSKPLISYGYGSYEVDDSHRDDSLLV